MNGYTLGPAYFGADAAATDAGGEGGGGADVAGLVTAIDQAIGTIANIIIYGIEHEANPVSRYLYAYDHYPDMIFGFNKVKRQLQDLKRNYDKARANIANPANWWNKSLGHAKDPPWMQGQKNIVNNYAANVRSLRYERSPGDENMSSLVDSYYDENSGNLEAYRAVLKNFVSVLLSFSALSEGMGVVVQHTTVPPQGLLTKAHLAAIWPGDPDAEQGRVPAALRGELFSRAMSRALTGQMPMDMPVPPWLLGMNEADVRSVSDPTRFPTYRTLAIIRAARDAQLQRQLQGA